MKYFFFFAFLFVAVTTVSAQNNSNLLELAQKIVNSKNIKTEDNQRFLSPLESSSSDYVPLLYQALGGPNDTVLSQILDRLTGNPFIGRGGDPTNLWILADAQTSLGSMSFRSAASQVSSTGFSVTTVADGIAKFLVTRAKEELSIAFFRKFKDDLENNPKIGMLFPTTTATLLLIDKQVYQFSRYLEALRESFIKDFKVMPTNLEIYLKSNRILTNQRLQILAEEALEVSQLVISGSSPEEIIDFLSSQGPVQDPSRRNLLPTAERDQLINMSAGFQGLSLFSHSLYNSGSGGGYLEPIQVSENLKNTDIRNLYLGLLWAHSGNIIFSDGKTLQEYIGKLAIDPVLLDNFIRLVNEFAQHSQKAERAALENQATAPDAENGTAYESYYRFFENLLDLFETGVEIKQSLTNMGGRSTALEDTLLIGIRHLNDLNFDIRKKHYAAAVNDLMYVLKTFLPNMATDDQQKIFNYGQFIATVATSNNSEEVAAAIEAIALPPGSSRVKKENYFSAAVNAYTGAGFGAETLSNNQTQPLLALSAPVGFSCSWKFKDKTPKANGKTRTPGSFSLFVPVIDVGALAAFRLNDPNTNDLPKLSWNNLLAPGLYGVFGFPNDLPIALGFGAQRGPNLREIGIGTKTTVSGWRYGMFLTVDIPVFNLYLQSKKVK